MTPEQCWNNLKRLYGESVYKVVERVMRSYGYPPLEAEICLNNIYPNECEHPFCPEHTAPRFDPWEGEHEMFHMR